MQIFLLAVINISLLLLLLFSQTTKNEALTSEGVGLETVHFELILLGDANFGQKLTDVIALIALQLNDFTILGMINHSAVTGELLFACFHNFLFIEIVRYALDSGQGFAAVTLLNPNVDQTVLSSSLITTKCISEWVDSFKVLNVCRHTIRVGRGRVLDQQKKGTPFGVGWLGGWERASGRD